MNTDPTSSTLASAMLACSIVSLLLIVWIGSLFGVSIPHVTRDAADVLNIHPFTGALSGLGIMLWWTSASIWLFSSAIHYALRATELFRFTLGFGLLSGYLAMDDMFQIHEHLAPFYLLVREESVYLLIASATLFLLVRFRAQLLRPGGVLFWLSLAFLAGSVAADQFIEPWLSEHDWHYLIEDGPKWVGIVSWCGFCIIRCYRDVLSSLSGKRLASEPMFVLGRQDHGNLHGVPFPPRGAAGPEVRKIRRP